VKKEAGVLSLRAMYDKKNPSHITVFEIYADRNAYNSHIHTAHFKKYKETVADMVLSLELTDVEPIVFEDKEKRAGN
jgi:quinol monooxygenase YgiN